ncbi:MAG: hypothetical protein ABF608_12375 [Sporolactobacillus sp.]
MQLIIEGMQSTFDNGDAEQLVALIQNTLQAAHRYYNYLIVDGRQISEPYAAYINEHFHEIEELELVGQSFEQLIYNNLASAKAYLDRVQEKLPPLAERFYQIPEAADWQGFADFLQGIGWIGTLVEALKNVPDERMRAQSLISCYGALEQKIDEMKDSVEARDAVAMADALTYELLPQIDTLRRALVTMLVREGEHHDQA